MYIIFIFCIMCMLPSLYSNEENNILSRQEKVYLHTDKPFYIIGDTIWLKGYLVDATSHKERDAKSCFLYVELIDRKNKVILRKKIKKEEGCFSNFLPIDGEIPEGDYALRAYTNLMRNESEEFFFTRPIKVYENITTSLYTNLRFETDKRNRMYAIVTLLTKNGDPHQGKRVDYMVRTKPLKNRYHKQRTNKAGEVRIKIPLKEELSQYIDLTMIDGDVKINRKLHLPDAYDYDVGFYPEGGHLIAGAKQIIAFKAESTTGISPRVTGYVLSQNTDTLARLQSEYEGIGSFCLTVAAEDTLQAVLTDEHGWTKTFRLPPATTSRVALAVEQDDSLLHYRLLVPQGTTPQQDDLSLMIHVRGRIVYTTRFFGAQLSGSIRKDSLPEGVVHLTVFKDSDEALTERLVFVRRQEPTLQVAFSGTPTNVRSLVKTGIRLVSDEGVPMRGKFSMSVTDDFAVGIDKENENIRSYLLIKSDLRGRVRDPGYYLDNRSPEKERHLDQLMLTQGWRRFSPTSTLRKTAPEENTPETKTQKKKVWEAETKQIIAGYVKGWFNRPTRKRQEVSIMAPKYNNMQIVSTDENGYFEFSHDYPDYTGFSVNLLNERKWMYNIELVEETFPEVIMDWESASQKKARTSYLTEVRKGLIVQNGEKVYQLPEVLVQGVSPYSEYAYYSIGTERLEQKKGKNALELLNQIPEVCIVGLHAHDPKGTKNILTESLEEDEWRIGLHLRRPTIGRNHMLSGGYPCRRAAVYVDGHKVLEEKSLEKLKAEDIKYIDILDRPIVRSKVIQQNDWLFSDDYPWMQRRSRSNRMGGGQSIWITSYRNNRGRFVESDGKNAKIVPLSYAKNAQFYAPKYPTEESRRIVNSDQRSTIHWEPDIRLNEKGEAGLSFYTADRPSTYTVVIEGITEEGRVCRFVKKIK